MHLTFWIDADMFTWTCSYTTFFYFHFCGRIWCIWCDAPSALFQTYFYHLVSYPTLRLDLHLCTTLIQFLDLAMCWQPIYIEWTALKWILMLTNKNRRIARIFNAEETCFVSSALRLPNHLPCIVSFAHAACCINSAKPKLTSLLCMHDSDVIPARPMKAFGDQDLEASWPSSVDGGELHNAASLEPR